MQRKGRCFSCGQEGHWAPECPSNPRAIQNRIIPSDPLSLPRDQKRDPMANSQPNVIPLLQHCLKNTSGVVYLSGYVHHVCSHYQEDKGWGCGYRNIQMLVSHLQRRSTAMRGALFAGCGFIPDIASLQAWLEVAWKAGFDVLGAQQLGWEVVGTRKWIGTTEAAALLRYFGVAAHIVDFYGTGRAGQYTGTGATIHTGVACDLCGTCPIVGVRYKSKVLDNFDVCGKCRGMEEAEQMAPFETVGTAGPSATANEPPRTSSSTLPTVHHNVECNLCGQRPIRGVRYQSQGIPDFDVCERCIHHPAAGEAGPYVAIGESQGPECEYQGDAGPLTGPPPFIHCVLCGCQPARGDCYKSAIIPDFHVCSACLDHPTADVGRPYQMHDGMGQGDAGGIRALRGDERNGAPWLDDNDETGMRGGAVDDGHALQGTTVPAEGMGPDVCDWEVAEVIDLLDDDEPDEVVVGGGGLEVLGSRAQEAHRVEGEDSGWHGKSACIQVDDIDQQIGMPASQTDPAGPLAAADRVPPECKDQEEVPTSITSGYLGSVATEGANMANKGKGGLRGHPPDNPIRHMDLIRWVWRYFSGEEVQEDGEAAKDDGKSQRYDGPGDASSPSKPLFKKLRSSGLTVTQRPPLYFQHEGHSRTIVGIECQGSGRQPADFTLLILDPGQRTGRLEGALKCGKGWEQLVKRGVHTLRKPEYQILYVEDELVGGVGREGLKTLMPSERYPRS